MFKKFAPNASSLGTLRLIFRVLLRSFFLFGTSSTWWTMCKVMSSLTLAPTKPVIFLKHSQSLLWVTTFPWFPSNYDFPFRLALTQSNGITAEARGGHNDLIQRFLITEHLKDLWEKQTEGAAFQSAQYILQVPRGC